MNRVVLGTFAALALLFVVMAGVAIAAHVPIAVAIFAALLCQAVLGTLLAWLLSTQIRKGRFRL